MNTFDQAQQNHDNAGPNHASEERALRLFEGQVKQMTEDLDYFAEQLFERQLNVAEQRVIARVLDAYGDKDHIPDSDDVDAIFELRNMLASLNVDDMMRRRP